MKLVLYSGGQTNKNFDIHRALRDLVPANNEKSITYIPFCEDGATKYYEQFKKRYRRFGFRQFQMLSVDKKVSEEMRAGVLESDVIYLAGGNTFYFLKSLQKYGWLRDLRKFVQQGGVLAGLSAGAIIMTPNIGLAGYPEYDKDENDVGLRRLGSLKLTSFEFFPHFYESKKLIQSMCSYSKQSKYPVIACGDGGGVVINGDERRFYGDLSIFSQGTHIRIKS